MHTLLVLVGKNNDSRLISMMEDFTKRINRYHRFDIQIIPELKNKGKMSENIQKQKEGQLIIEKLKAGDWVVYDYRLMHRGIGNESKDTRRPILQFMYAVV